MIFDILLEYLSSKKFFKRKIDSSKLGEEVYYSDGNKSLYLFYIPFPSYEKARDISENVIDAGYARCANILSSVQSIYKYAAPGQEEKLITEQEVPVIFKVAEALKDDFVAYMESTHPYEMPPIICIEASANQVFAHWVNRVEL